MAKWGEDGKLYHLGLKDGDVGRYVLLPGDPGRVALIAAFLKDARQVGQRREYVTWTGTLLGERVSVCSTGIGAPSTAIAAEELIAVGADTLIRVGTAGMIQSDILPESIVIATGAVRDEGTSRQYIPIAYPAIADYQVVSALVESARALNINCHSGIVQSKDSFYGELEPDTMPTESFLNYQHETWLRGRVLASEMEAAALFVVASIRQKRAGCILNHQGDMRKTIQISVNAIERLIMLDKEKQR